VFLVLLACSDEERADADEPYIERTEAVDVGTVCLLPPPEGRSFTYARMRLGGCIDGCKQLAAASCELDVVGQEIFVHSSFRFEEQRGGNVVCPTGCEPGPSVSCTPIEHRPGKYTVHLGDASTTVTLGNDPVVLFGSDAAALEGWCE